VAGRFAVRGWLRQYVLRIGGAAAAVNYGFSLRGRSYYYIGGFDPQFEPSSPGALLLQHVLSEAIAEGVAEFDLLRGGELYKYRWGAESRPQYRLRSAAPLALQGGSRPTCG
jgi:CelD/BcsL family acetyltransferase involved in cellulose biosynthesis